MKISQHLNKVSDSFNVTAARNGFVFEVSGRDEDNEYRSIRLLCSDVDSLCELIKEYNSMEIDY